MLEYALRLSSMWIAARRRGPLDLFDGSVVRLRVWPSDLDVYGHMNNGRYLTVMDLGRTDLVIRTGMWGLMLQRRWKPLLGSATIRFRRPLTPLRRYELHTRLLCWDAKWFFIQQQFHHHGKLHAVAVVKGLVRGTDGNVPPQDLFAELGGPSASPPMPPAIRTWLDAEESIATSEGSP